MSSEIRNVRVIISYGGTWQQHNEEWRFVTKMPVYRVLVPLNVTYSRFVSVIERKCGIDPSVFVTRIAYMVAGFNGVYILRSQEDVTGFLENAAKRDDVPTIYVYDYQVSQKRSRNEVDKGTMAKKLANSEEQKQESMTMAEEYRSGSSLEALSSCHDQLSHEPSSFNNLKGLNQTDPIPRMPAEVRNHLFESSPIATSVMDLSQVPNKRSRHEVDNNTVFHKLEREKQQIETVAKEKRILEEKMCVQDELIEEQKVILEAMKLQHEKRMVEAKIHVQDKIIARQKAMLEAMKLRHENEMLEEKRRMQDEVIEGQKVMLETMRLQNEKRMFEAKIQRQDKIVAQQKAMLEAMKLQHENIETEHGNIDS